MGAVLSLIAITVGAVLRFATTIHSSTWNVGALGDIIMVAGAVGLLAAIIAQVYWESGSTRSYLRRRAVTNSEIRGVIHGPTGYARTSYDANYPNVAAVPVAVAGPVVAPSAVNVESEETVRSSVL